ncbi:hypothetical protein C8A05DRAFT_39373, partial [Staphylotrichum tortipilum]
MAAPGAFPEGAMSTPPSHKPGEPSNKAKGKRVLTAFEMATSDAAQAILEEQQGRIDPDDDDGGVNFTYNRAPSRAASCLRWPTGADIPQPATLSPVSGTALWAQEKLNRRREQIEKNDELREEEFRTLRADLQSMREEMVANMFKYTDDIATRQSQAPTDSTVKLDKRIDGLVEGRLLGLGLWNRDDNDRPRPSDSGNRHDPAREANHDEARRDDDKAADAN